QLITGGLQIRQTLLVMLLLLAQFGTHAGTLALQTTQLFFLVGALLGPFAGLLLCCFTRLAKQFALTPQGGKFGLLPAIVLLLAAQIILQSIELRTQAFLGQSGLTQSLFQQ